MSVVCLVKYLCLFYLRFKVYFETSLCGRCRTATFKDKKDELNPGWFELLTLPFNMPTFSEMLQVCVSVEQTARRHPRND